MGGESTIGTGPLQKLFASRGQRKNHGKTAPIEGLGMTPELTGWEAAAASPPRLPREGLRDLWNEFRQDVKCLFMPFRGFYRFRAYFYARSRYPELRFLKHLADPKAVALDVGANLGLYTFFLARACRHVYAFEP